MAITHDDILNREFPLRFRGYDTDEVDTFLEEVAKEMASLNRENNRLNEEIVRLRKEMEELKEKEAELRQAVLSAHRLAEDMREQLVGERKLLVEKAKVEVDKILASAGNELSRIQGRVEELRRVKKELVTKLKATLEGYLRLIEEEDGGDEGAELGPQLLEEIGEEVKSELESLGLSLKEVGITEYPLEEQPNDSPAAPSPGLDREPGASPSAAPSTPSDEHEKDIPSIDLGPALD